MEDVGVWEADVGIRTDDGLYPGAIRLRLSRLMGKLINQHRAHCSEIDLWPRDSVCLPEGRRKEDSDPLFLFLCFFPFVQDLGALGPFQSDGFMWRRMDREDMFFKCERVHKLPMPESK